MNATTVQHHATVAQVIYLGHVAMLTLLGNSLVIVAFHKGPRSRMKTFTNYFVVNLAVSDIMVGCISVPFWICVLLGLTNGRVDRYFTALDVLSGTTSILSLTLISLERLFAIKFPTQHYNTKRRHVIGGVVSTWTGGVLLFLVAIIWSPKINDIQRYQAVTTTIFVMAFLLPLTVISVSYAVILITAVNMTIADNQVSRRVSRDIRIAKTISVIIGLFVVCWAPFFVANMTFVYCKSCLTLHQWAVATRVTKALHYSNSMMNFFVYAVRSPEFRGVFCSVLCSRCCDDARTRWRAISLSSVYSSRNIRENNREVNSSESRENNSSESRDQSGSLLRVPYG